MAILVVDDNPLQRRLLESVLRKLGYDLVTPNFHGMGVPGWLHQAAIKVPVIAQGGIEAGHAGAGDYALKTNALEREIQRIDKRRADTLDFADITTRSPNVAGVIGIAEKAAVANIVVLIAGEPGVDKELITCDAPHLLVGVHWPGDIGQLKNAVLGAVALAEGDNFWLAEFQQISARAALEPPLAAGLSGVRKGLKPGPEPAQDTPRLTDEAPRYPADAPVDAPAIADLAFLDAAGEVRPLEEVEAELIRFAIGHYHGQMSKVARRLRISRSTLYRKLEALELAPSAAAAAREAARDEKAQTAPVAAERQPRKIA